MRATTNYQLPLYEMGDNANLADGFNNAMEILDVKLYQMFSMLTNTINSIATLQTQVASLETRVAALEQKASA